MTKLLRGFTVEYAQPSGARLPRKFRIVASQLVTLGRNPAPRRSSEETGKPYQAEEDEHLKLTAQDNQRH
jgi:hypothetical protein